MARNFLQTIVFVVFYVNTELTLGEVEGFINYMISDS